MGMGTSTAQTDLYGGAGARVAWRPAGSRAWHVAYADTRHGVADAIDRLRRHVRPESVADAQLNSAWQEWHVEGRAWVLSAGAVVLMLDDDGAMVVVSPALEGERFAHAAAAGRMRARRAVKSRPAVCSTHIRRARVLINWSSQARMSGDAARAARYLAAAGASRRAAAYLSATAGA